MPRQSKHRLRRIKNLMIITTLSAILLSISTYAWFVGMRTVNVSRFDVEIAATESLLLSLDGETWESTINISEDILDLVSYEGHTNSWGGEGLIPMSSVGEMDVQASRMKLFEKASLTPTPGGYRLLASRVNNYGTGESEKDGYVVFDLFIHNFSGNHYIPDLNELDEEAIYLTVDSAVTVAEGGVANTGIENSVRVGFAQIGRVNAQTATTEQIIGITCDPAGEGNISIANGVTGICRTAQIWEPNDKSHVEGAINWYDTSCRQRTGDDVTDESSYDKDTPCLNIADGNAYPTYAIRDVIDDNKNVDIYDGFNSYMNNIYDPDSNPTGLLQSYDYFTDSKKNLTGTDRPAFMTLAPNSITKVRVYIWIEGQDIDNYDFASIGKRISVKFGFTKERFTPDDLEYLGPGLDMTKPVIQLNGEKEIDILQGSEYVDPGFTATDKYYAEEDGNWVEKERDVTADVVVDTSKLDVNQLGTYLVYYRVTDEAGNSQTEYRIVNVVDSLDE